MIIKRVKVFLYFLIIVDILVFSLIFINFLNMILDDDVRDIVSRFKSDDYYLVYYDENKKSFNDIVLKMKNSNISVISKDLNKYELSKEYSFETNDFGNDKKIAMKIVSKMISNGYNSVSKVEMDNDCVVYKISIISISNSKISYFYSDDNSCLIDHEVVEDKYGQSFKNIRKKVDDHWLFEYNNIPSL